MRSKIDKNLLRSVNTLNIKDKKECIVYVQNFCRAKQYMEKNFKNEFESFPFINAFKINLNYVNIFKVAKLNIVKYVSGNAKVHSMINTSRKILNVEKVSNKTSNFSIAIIDTGLYPHIDIMMPKNKILLFKDFINEKNVIYDDNGHGTFVTGVLCGSGIISDKKYIGIDNNVNLIILKSLDKNGETTVSTILNAMQWVYDNKKKFNIKIVNMSFGSLPINKNDPLILGAEVLWDNGITVVCAAGNSGPDSETIRSPGASSKIITVGAMDDKRKVGLMGNVEFDISKFEVADFSSRGPIYNNYKPDLIVPGVDIIGLSNFGMTKEFYTTMSGTSVATPMITGICSLILKNNPNFSPNQIKKTLIENCVPITGDRNSEGFGWFNGSVFKK